jgi:hypothetical protein
LVQEEITLFQTFFVNRIAFQNLLSLSLSLIFNSFNVGSEFVVDEAEEHREDEFLQSQKLDNFPKILKNKGEVQIARKISLFVIECSIEQLIRGEEMFFIPSDIHFQF